MAQSGGLFALPFSAPVSWCPATALRSPEIVPTGGTGITEGCDRPACPWTTETGCSRNRPVLYLNSWAWVRGQQRAGTWPPPNRTGRAYTIMARPCPEYGETGDGSVPVLTPQGHEVALMQQLVRSRAVTGLDQDDVALIYYRSALETRWSEGGGLEPRSMLVRNAVGLGRVEHGDTLCCACSMSDARAERCHRAWAAPLLSRAGWAVVLDGVPVVTSG